jgi:predicted nucleotidyltransferase
MPAEDGDETMSPDLKIPYDRLKAFCLENRIRELSIFGSAVREDFGPQSDVDVLVEFQPDADLSLMDVLELQEELKSLFGREVDLIEKRALRNPFRRYAILKSKETIYAA